MQHKVVDFVDWLPLFRWLQFWGRVGSRGSNHFTIRRFFAPGILYDKTINWRWTHSDGSATHWVNCPRILAMGLLRFAYQFIARYLCRISCRNFYWTGQRNKDRMGCSRFEVDLRNNTRNQVRSVFAVLGSGQVVKHFILHTRNEIMVWDFKAILRNQKATSRYLRFLSTPSQRRDVRKSIGDKPMVLLPGFHIRVELKLRGSKIT